MPKPISRLVSLIVASSLLINPILAAGPVQPLPQKHASVFTEQALAETLSAFFGRGKLTTSSSIRFAQEGGSRFRYITRLGATSFALFSFVSTNQVLFWTQTMESVVFHSTIQ